MGLSTVGSWVGRHIQYVLHQWVSHLFLPGVIYWWSYCENEQFGLLTRRSSTLNLLSTFCLVQITFFLIIYLVTITLQMLHSESGSVSNDRVEPEITVVSGSGLRRDCRLTLCLPTNKGFLGEWNKCGFWKWMFLLNHKQLSLLCAYVFVCVWGGPGI